MKGMDLLSVDINLSEHEDEVIEWVVKNNRPDDIFDEEELSQWARDNGYILEDEIEEEARKIGLVPEKEAE